MAHDFRLNSREMPPCKDCSEKFTACHDRCPKDERGEIGYAAWKAGVDRNRKEAEKQKPLYAGKYWRY